MGGGSGLGLGEVLDEVASAGTKSTARAGRSAATTCRDNREHKRRGNLCGAAVSNEVRTRATPHIPASAAPVGCQQSAPRNIYPANGNCKSELEVGYEPGGSWCA